MRDPRRKEYVEECRKRVRDLFDSQRILVQYSRDKKRRKVGVVIAYMAKTGMPGLRLGWSKCNVKLDEFNRYVGIAKAYAASDYDHKNPPNVHSMNDDIDEMIGRAKRYFKLDESSVAK